MYQRNRTLPRCPPGSTGSHRGPEAGRSWRRGCWGPGRRRCRGADPRWSGAGWEANPAAPPHPAERSWRRWLWGRLELPRTCCLPERSSVSLLRRKVHEIKTWWDHKFHISYIPELHPCDCGFFLVNIFCSIRYIYFTVSDFVEVQSWVRWYSSCFCALVQSYKTSGWWS